MNYSVYVIQNAAGLLYKGISANLPRRLRDHNKDASNWTRKRGPWKLVYHEDDMSKSEALKREKFLKSGKGREFIKKYLSECSAVGSARRLGR